MPNDRDRVPSTNVAPNAPVYVGRMSLTAGTPARLSVPLAFKDVGEGFTISIVNLPTPDAVAPAAVQFLVNNQAPEPTAPQLANAETLLPGCTYRQPLPAWLDRVTVDAQAVDQVALTTPANAEVNVIVYRMDRTVREDWKGR